MRRVAGANVCERCVELREVRETSVRSGVFGPSTNERRRGMTTQSGYYGGGLLQVAEYWRRSTNEREDISLAGCDCSPSKQACDVEKR